MWNQWKRTYRYWHRSTSAGCPMFRSVTSDLILSCVPFAQKAPPPGTSHATASCFVFLSEHICCRTNQWTRPESRPGVAEQVRRVSRLLGNLERSSVRLGRKDWHAQRLQRFNYFPVRLHDDPGHRCSLMHGRRHEELLGRNSFNWSQICSGVSTASFQISVNERGSMSGSRLWMEIRTDLCGFLQVWHFRFFLCFLDIVCGSLPLQGPTRSKCVLVWSIGQHESWPQMLWL